MFNQLFGSKTRVKLLSLFYNNPERPFYVREITRKITEQINSVRRELQNLLNIGIVKSVNQSNRLYYEVNTKYKFYNELTSIFTKIPAKSKEIKETKEEDQIIKKVSKAGNVRLLFLTGAFVRGSNQMIDLFIVGDVNKAKLSQIITDIEKQMTRELNYTVMRVEDFDYRRNLNDRFLSDVLDAKKIVLIDQLEVFSKPEATPDKKVKSQLTEAAQSSENQK
ncbi:MAG: transcriptional regulator [bacterium]|nr:transcriptional regulator [bacterium]